MDNSLAVAQQAPHDSPDQQSSVQPSPEHPQQESAAEQQQSVNLLPAEKAKLVDIVRSYRTEWSADRTLRLPGWMRNAMMYKGSQDLVLDPATNTYFDSMAWYRQTNQTDDIGLERHDNNITQMYATSFIASVARGVPPTIMKPENAENLADTTTAKASETAIEIIERFNKVKEMVQKQALYMFLYGAYFKWTRLKIGQWAGYKEVPELQAKVISIPERMHCSGCGTDNPGVPGECAQCGKALGASDYYPPEETQMSVNVSKKVPKGMVKWDVYGPLDVDIDPQVETPADSPVLALDMEVDIADLRATFPEDIELILEGSTSATSGNSAYERLVRTLIYAKGNTDTSLSTKKPTYTQAWIQPRAYYRLETDANSPFLQKMKQNFPEGCMVGMCGEEVLIVRSATLGSEWTGAKLRTGVGAYPPSIADSIVSYNVRLNDISDTVDDWMERCATGVVLCDGSKLDARKMSGKRILSGVWNTVYTKRGEASEPLSNAIYQFEYKLDPQIFQYRQQLITEAQLIAGIPPQVPGTGTLPGVETAKGQQQMLDQALGVLDIYWDAMKTEQAEAAQNAIECLQASMQYVGDIYSVIEDEGSEFRNNYVRMQDMQGRVRVYPAIDQGLPRSASQVREWWTNAIDNAEKNPVYQAILDIPENQEQAIAAVGVEGLVTPNAAMRSKTLEDIKNLLGAEPIPTKDQQGNVVWQPTVSPNKDTDDFKIQQQTVKRFCQTNSDYQTQNPKGWANLMAYLRLSYQFETEIGMEVGQRGLKVKQASTPPGPQPSPQEKEALQVILQDASAAVQNLASIGATPPLPKGSSLQAQVSANKEIVDAALKAQAATQG